MKLIMILGFILSSAIYAAEPTVFLNDNHRLYIEPDVAYEIPNTIQKESYTIKDSGYLLGINAGYEFLKPNFVYAKLEANFSMSNHFSDLNFEHEKFSDEMKGFQNKTSGAIGYTLVNSNVWFTPFSGAGCYFLSQQHGHLYLGYVPLGIKTEYRMANLSIGVNAQQLHFVRMWHRYGDTKYSKNIFGNFGYEISLPLSVKMDTAEQHWYTTFEPYYLKLTDDAAFVGGRIAGMYNF